MKGVVFLGDRRVEVRDFPVPEPGPGEVRVRMTATSICGSDLHIFRLGSERFADGARIPGHEPSGVVDALGAGIEHLEQGDRICVNHYLGCGYCGWCASGYVQWCSEARGYGGPIDGSHADFILADERNCVPLPESLSFVDGAFIACAGGTAYSAMRKLDVSGPGTVLVSGLGPVGLSGVLIAKAFGGTVIGVDVIQERVELASALGADVAINASQEDPLRAMRDACGPDGLGLAFETSGAALGRKMVVDALARRGKAAFVGVGSDEPVINPSEIISRELTLMGSFVLPIGQTYDLVSFLDRKGLSFAPIVTHRFAIDDAVEAYRAADESKTGKVAFVWS